MKTTSTILAALVAALAACTSRPAAPPSVCGSPDDLTAPADVTLTARDAALDLGGATFVAWTYDGDVPGPVLRMNLGETRRVKLVNASPRPASLHFHGVSYPLGDDGTSGASLVDPGCAHVYTIAADAPGVWAYHSHREARTEMARGLHGAVVVPWPDEAPADREYVAFLGQLGLESEAEGGEEAEEAGAKPPYFAMTINGRPDGHALAIAWDPAQERYVAAAGAVASARVGERVRWRVVNVSPDDAHTFHLHGHGWCDRGGVPDAAGSCPDGTLPVDNFDVFPAQGVSFEYVERAEAGTWMLHCHVVDHVTDGMYAEYEVLPP